MEVAFGMQWFTYIVRCNDNSLYTGITTDIDKRITMHNTKKGSVYVRSKLPVVLVYYEVNADKSAAAKRERQIKNWSKIKKEKLITGRLY
jgi:putative endonuclease